MIFFYCFPTNSILDIDFIANDYIDVDPSSHLLLVRAERKNNPPKLRWNKKKQMKLRVIANDIVKYCFIMWHILVWFPNGIQKNQVVFDQKQLFLLEINKIELHKRTITVCSLWQQIRFSPVNDYRVFKTIKCKMSLKFFDDFFFFVL